MIESEIVLDYSKRTNAMKKQCMMDMAMEVMNKEMIVFMSPQLHTLATKSVHTRSQLQMQKTKSIRRSKLP